jgi:hypothetical protein
MAIQYELLFQRGNNEPRHKQAVGGMLQVPLQLVPEPAAKWKGPPGSGRFLGPHRHTQGGFKSSEPMRDRRGDPNRV